MGSRQNPRCTKIHRHFTTPLLIIVVLCTLNAEARILGKGFGSSKIGSRPPKCDRRCNDCGRCEAIQVPTNPQVGAAHKNSNNSSAIPTISSYEGYSNYKPMSWKCKCGNLIFNP